MTLATILPRRMALPVAALAALFLAGCSSGHVGESWQCPLAEGGSCDSVAAADPAVPDMVAARDTVLGDPLWRVHGGENGTAPRKADGACEAACDAGFDPFAWLARLFDRDTADGEKTAGPGPVRPLPSGTEASAAPMEGTAALPAEPDAEEMDAGGEAAPDDHDDLRTDEVVARIWIAPFVDAEGVYREASWVRVVLAPAGWRLGR